MPGTPGVLEVLKPEIPLNPPEPAVEDKWVGIATDQNPLLLAARAATETARQEIDIQRAGHYPTVNLTADYTWLNNDFGGFGITQERNDSAIGVQMTLPLYQGGLVVANTRQSQHQFNQAQENQVQQRRATERQARDYYRGVITGISKVLALNQAVKSNEKAQEAAEAGFEVGTRTIVDVLDAQSNLLSAKRDYARSRYDYLLDMLRLKQAAGILSEEDLQLINGLLQ
jgi:outer membrane protein